MIPSVTINDVRGQSMLNDLREATGKDAAVILHDEFRLLMKQIITLTPPHGLGQSALAAGEGAVKSDLGKAFQPVDEELLNEIGSKFGVDGIDTWITGKSSGDKIHLLWDRLDPSGEGMSDFHQKHRDSRGRVRGVRKKVIGAWAASYVVAKQDFAEYLKKILSHVGRRKAGWAVAYMELGGKVQEWIRRHVNSGANGDVEIRLSDPNNMRISAFNSSPGIKDDERIIRDAQRVRREAMAKKLALIISCYSKDVAQKIRPRRRAQLTPETADATT
jgi:hypothetical protein